MKSRWTFRCYPTPEQEQHLARTFGCVRFVWNWALRARTDAFRAGERMGYPATDKALTALKATPEHVWLNEVSSVCLQQALRDLQTAFSNFFAKRAAYPAFKRKEARQSANYTERGFSFDAERRILKLAKIGSIKVKWSRKAIPHPSSVRLIRTASGKYFVSLVVETLPAPLPKTGEAVGIDFGVARLATLSNGERVGNPKHGAKWQRRLAFYQKRLARAKKGSKRREKVKRHVALIHEKIANSRSDTLHKLSTDLVTRFDVICVEDLHLRGMVKNHSLARSLHDASIGTAIRMIEDKAERYGKTVVKIDRWFPSSKTCSACGHVVEKLPLSVREWCCPECGTHHDRDANAAVNILAVGQTASANGGTGRRSRATAGERKSLRSSNRQGVNRA
ncbi:MAG: RNA-guided endonuclease TnpB family protein [Candidatus Moranbacteria bacterium]|nr:RNA-guided endonuclease TnpB family protein [Candidatus Moranbacteria bacterium]